MLLYTYHVNIDPLHFLSNCFKSVFEFETDSENNVSKLIPLFLHSDFFLNFRWSHEYQEACIEKLERFLTGIERNYPENDLANIYAANLHAQASRRISGRRGIEQQISYEGLVQVRRGSRGILDQQMISPEIYALSGPGRCGRGPLDQQRSDDGSLQGRSPSPLVHSDLEMSPNINSINNNHWGVGFWSCWVRFWSCWVIGAVANEFKILIHSVVVY